MGCFTEGSADGLVNGTGDTVVVPPPGAGVRRIVRTMSVSTSIEADLSVELKNGADYRVIWAGALKAGDTWQWGDGGDVLILDATSKSVVARLTGTIVDPMDYITAWGDQE